MGGSLISVVEAVMDDGGDDGDDGDGGGLGKCSRCDDGCSGVREGVGGERVAHNGDGGCVCM